MPRDTGEFKFDGSRYNVTSFQEGFVDHVSIGGSGGNFAATEPYLVQNPGRDINFYFCVKATIPAGNRTKFGPSDDGRVLQIPGNCSRSKWIVNVSSVRQGTDTIGYGYLIPHTNSRGAFEVTTEPTTKLYGLFWQGPGSNFEIAISDGDQTSYGGQIDAVFKILNDDELSWKVEAVCDENAETDPQEIDV